jgi:hypothetical protein
MFILGRLSGDHILFHILAFGGKNTEEGEIRILLAPSKGWIPNPWSLGLKRGKEHNLLKMTTIEREEEGDRHEGIGATRHPKLQMLSTRNII